MKDQKSQKNSAKNGTKIQAFTFPIKVKRATSFFIVNKVQSKNVFYNIFLAP